MDIDHDIKEMLNGIEVGVHSLDKGIELFISTLPGYDYRFHRPLTVKKYEDCLCRNPHNFKAFLAGNGKANVEQVTREDAIVYKDMLLNKMDSQSVRPFITSVRQLLRYWFKLGWLKEDLSLEVKPPKVKRREQIKILQREVEEEVVNGSWGINSLVIARNHLIACLFIKRGLHPKEFATLLEEHIHPFEDLAYLNVFGKRDVPRDVMLDPESFEALKIWMIERAHFMHVNKIHLKNIFLSINPHNGSYALMTPGVQAVIRRIKHELKLNGCLWDLSVLNPQGCRRTAVSRDFERAEYSPVHHPEMTICGQYGHSLEVSQKHYWRKSLMNAYRLIKGIGMNEPESKPPEPPAHRPENPPSNGPKNIFPPNTFFGDFGVGI